MIEKDIILEEYKVLKLEQLERIKIRDTLIYISLGIFGGIFSYSMFQNEIDKSIVLLVLPTVSFVLSWTYLVNDEKISHIGKYVREVIKTKMESIFESKKEENNNIENKKSDANLEIIFGWESYHKDDDGRIPRKLLQTAMDFIAFAFPALISLTTYYCKMTKGLFEYEPVIIILLVWSLIITGLTSYLLIFYDFSEKFGKGKTPWQIFFWLSFIILILLIAWKC